VAGTGKAAVFYMLMDNFKDVKDKLGLGAADMLIRDVADLLKENTGANDVVARFGDHSFTILRKDCEAEAVQELAEHIRQAIENHITEVENQSITTTCSIGMSLLAESTPSGQEVISRADLACEVARSSGGNQSHLHNPVVDEKIGKERDHQMHALIKEALDNDQLKLLYQPIVSLQGDPTEKYEVLLRMTDENGEHIFPNQFLPIAEQTGQIAEIDRWVIKQAVSTLAEHRGQGADARFFIKLSASTLLDEELVQYIHECIKSSRLPGDALTFEIAEKHASQHLKHAKACIRTLQALHCKTALEHFGAEPNSFQLLKHLAVDYLKIDGSFIQNLAGDNESQAKVKAILDTANPMEIQCIAEFVEDAHSLAVLWQSGIHFIQGNFLQEASESLDYDFSSEVA